MKEYSIYCIYGSGMPFYLSTYNSYYEAYTKLLDMIALEEKRNRPFFIDNNFYNNKFIKGMPHMKYFSIHVRDVSEWEKYDEQIHNSKNNIIYFNKKA